MPPPTKLTDLSVLVIDDNQHHVAIVSDMLRAAGFTRLSTAVSSEEAAAEMKARRLDLVIMEWDMEPVDGIEFAKRIRRGELGVDRRVPIVMLTSRATIADVETARKAGVHEYAIKPVSPTTLLARVEAATTRPRRFVDSPVYIGPCRRRSKVDDYRGPLRRLSDPVGEEETRARAAAGVQQITDAAKHFNPHDRGQVRKVFTAAKDLRRVAFEIGDAPLDRSANSLIRYVEGVGATTSLEADVVRTHVDALAQLVMLPNAQAVAREQVSQGLERVVDKKLKQARDAAA